MLCIVCGYFIAGEACLHFLLPFDGSETLQVNSHNGI